ncbi:MAG TPA: nucleotide pyrophosphohydrolase [Thermodesulfobacteriota bacterium]|nr:nucleotide pyrophosphohydrolase [Thermodesulfobacteriota bacterium]
MISSPLLEEMLAFRHERDWEKFHTTRNLTSALCVEAAELLDIFRWARDSEITSIIREQRSEIESEVADVAILLMYLCHDLNISVEDVVRKKLAINRKKYPIEKVKGISTKYNNLD